MKKERIEEEALNSIYQKWVTPLLNLPHAKWSTDISRVNLRYGVGKEFEDYLWSCGGRIGKEYGKRYAEFFEEQDMIMFLLKWS